MASNAVLHQIVRRCISALPVMLGASLVTFILVDLLPGTVVEQLGGLDASYDQLARMRASLKLDDHPAVRYVDWLRGVASGDLGISLASGQKVVHLLIVRLPVTLHLVCLTFVIALTLATVTSVAAAERPGGLVDSLVGTLTVSALSTANYIFALVFILVFAVAAGWFPAVGYSPPSQGIGRTAQYLFLPASALALPLWGVYTRFLRNDLLDQMEMEDYTIAAAARGLTRRQVLLRHALPNSLIGVLALVGLHVGSLLGGAVVIEQIFGLPGVGQLLVQSVHLRDTPVIQGVVLWLALTTVLSNLAADIAQTLIDPRVRRER
jgi:peptide/nickel transport system permease protein